MSALLGPEITKDSPALGDEALLLADGDLTSQNSHVAKVLRFFGVRSRAVLAADLLADEATGGSDGSKIRLLCSADTFLKLLEGFQGRPEGNDLWEARVHSAFVYASNDLDSLQALATRVMDARRVWVVQTGDRTTEWAVSDRFSELCGVMSGVRVFCAGTAAEAAFVC